MFSTRNLRHFFIGTDAAVARLLGYWALGGALYVVGLMSMCLLAWLGMAPWSQVRWQVFASVAGVVVAYLSIRFSPQLGLKGSVIILGQVLYAFTCIVGAYAMVGPMRGLAISLLLSVLVFGGFSSTRGQIRASSLYAVFLLGSVMLLMSRLQPERYPPQEEMINFAVATSMLIAVAYMAGRLSELRREVKRRTQALAEALARIQEMAVRDELTRLFNRGHMGEILAAEWSRRDRLKQPPCIALIDIDHFKRVNDSLGHAAGDAVLRGFAQTIVNALRGHDVLARWGGEEFLLLLPDTPLEGACAVLERLHTQLAVGEAGQTGMPVRVTFSAGLVQVRAGETIESAIERADQAMYRAKNDGRARIVVEPAPTLQHHRHEVAA
jgi:diguanylate cyclase (GGDEF)-like protein